MKVFNRWEVTMDTSRKDANWRATWRDGKESITHYFTTFTGMVGYLGVIDFYSFREYWNRQRRLYNMVKAA
jgi:hypothetical protein